MSKAKIAAALVAVFGIAYCSLRPAPTMIGLDYPLGAGDAKAVSRDFWTAFGANDRDALAPAPCEADPVGDSSESLVCRLLAATRAAPQDSTLPMLVAGAYLWRVQTGLFPATRIPDLQGAAEFSKAAAKLGNDYAPGFQASAQWLLAIITHDDDLGREAAALLEANTHRWAAFQGFIEMEQLSTRLAPDQKLDDADFAMARKAWGYMMSSCLLGDWTPEWLRIPAKMPINNFIMNTTWLAIHVTGERICWNNEPAPFSLPATFVVAGDMFLKQGEFDTARVLYQNSTRAPGYEGWSYKQLPVERLADLPAYREAFLSDSGRVLGKNPKRSMVGQSAFYCVMCHSEASAPH